MRAASYRNSIRTILYESAGNKDLYLPFGLSEVEAQSVSSQIVCSIGGNPLPYPKKTMQPLTSLGYKRRKFLQLSLAIAAFGLSWSCSREKSKSRGSVLVIGAGVSGLAAARELRASGFEVTVLEGRDRIGGRIHTDRTLGWPIDLGASWIHGIEGNPITKLARDFNVPILPTDYDNIEIYGSDGSPLRETEIERLYAIYEKMGYRLFSLAEDLEEDISIAEAIRRIGIPKKITPREINIVKWFLDSEIVVASGADLDRLSLWYADEGEAFGGDDYMFPNGYDQIIQGLARGIDIRLEHKVMEIEYGGDRGRAVSVKTNQGSFAADAAVVTLPLGVLKSGAVKFSPPLSEGKRAAIARLDMGVLNKVVLKFPQTFWPEELDGFGYIGQSQKDLSEFLNLSHYIQTPILIAFTGGSLARSLEDLSLEEIGDRAMKPLRRVYGNNIPDPLAVTRTRWNADPFSFGSYSYIPVGATAGDRSILAKPASGNLFFAGEATSAQYPATVHGAFLSGIREASRIKNSFEF